MVALGVIDALQKQGRKVGLLRPLVASRRDDPMARDLVGALGLDQARTDVLGSTYAEMAADPEAGIAAMEAHFGAMAEQHDTVVVIGSDFTDVITPYEAALNARIAVNLDCPVVAVVKGEGRDPSQIARAAGYLLNDLVAKHLTIAGVVATQVASGSADATAEALRALPGAAGAPVSVLPAVPALAGPLSGHVADVRGALAIHLDAAAIVARLDEPRQALRTLHRFEYEVAQRARANLMTIVLPESGDDRILKAAAVVLERGTADLILLGEEDVVRARAKELGVNIARARVQSMADEEARDRYASAYAELRKAKGVTLDQARAKMEDPSYFGTMMVKLGEANAMVSGATHTTANTIRPSFEVIKTKPGIEVVSGAFFMCMADDVWLMADCAVNPNPNPSELASIAISSAESAAAFGIEPRVAMLSYSTGTSGKGPDVDRVAEATKLARERRPDLAIDGPMQFDAAVDGTVAALKMPGSPVAGNATVFVFPDLDAGNLAYKAVQRTSGATAIGPMLQGLNKVVTDLSRGALVEDIISTIALTAVQAQAV